MNFKTTIFLVILALAVSLFFIISGGSFNISSPPPAPAKKGTALPVAVNLDASNVQKITIEKDHKTYVLARSGAKWMEQKPVHFPVNSYSAQHIARDALSLRYVQRFTPGASGTPSLKDVGLNPAQATVTLSGKAGELTIDVGTPSIGGKGYVAIKGDKHVYAVADTLQNDVLNHSDHDWRTKSLSVPKASAANEIILRRGHQTIDLNKLHGNWFLGQKDNQRASGKKVASLLKAINDTSIQKFVSDNPKNLGLYGLVKPTIEITVHKPAVASGSKAKKKSSKPAASPLTTKTYVLRIGAAASLKHKKYFATFSHGHKASPVVFTIQAADRKNLDKSTDDMRDPRVLTSTPDEVDDVTVSRAGKPTIHLVKSDNAFSFGKPKPKYGLDYQAAHKFIDHLTSLKASGYTANFKPRGKAVATVTVQVTGVGRGEQLHIYKAAKGGGYLSVRNHEPVAYHLTAKAAALLFEPRLALRNKDVLNLPASKLGQVSLRRDDGVQFVFDRKAPPATQATSQPTTQPGTWTLKGHKQFESNSFQNLLGDLHPLRVKKWLATPVQAGKGWMTLAIDPAKGSPHVLRVDPANRDATLTGVHDGFVVSNTLAKKLEGEYRLRTVLPADIDDLKQVTVLQGEPAGKTVTPASLEKSLAAFNPNAKPVKGLVIRRDSAGDYTTPGAKKLDQAADASLFDTLADLSVKRYTPNHKFGVIVRRLRVTTQSGDTVEVVCFKGDQHRAWIHGKMDGKTVSRWFTLSSDDMGSLTAKLVKNKKSAAAS